MCPPPHPPFLGPGGGVRTTLPPPPAEGSRSTPLSDAREPPKKCQIFLPALYAENLLCFFLTNVCPEGAQVGTLAVLGVKVFRSPRPPHSPLLDQRGTGPDHLPPPLYRTLHPCPAPRVDRGAVAILLARVSRPQRSWLPSLSGPCRAEQETLPQGQSLCFVCRWCFGSFQFWPFHFISFFILIFYIFFHFHFVFISFHFISFPTSSSF